MTAFLVGGQSQGTAIDDRSWTWAFACDQAAAAGWPMLTDDDVELTLSGSVDLDQRTPGLTAIGAGSDRINAAVLGGAATRWSSASFPDPADSPILFRLILRDLQTTGISTYLELSQAAQQVTIRRNGTDLEIIGQLGAYTETIALDAFLGEYVLLDVILDPAALTFRAFLNGIDFTPSFTGTGDIDEYEGAATLALLSTVAGGNYARNTELVFAGILIDPALTIEEHRQEARDLGVLANGVATDDLGGYTWAWSPCRFDDDFNLPGDPDFGDSTALLIASDGIAYELETNDLRPEGLGRPRVGNAFMPGESADTLVSQSGFPIVDDDLHLRIIFKILDTADGVQRVLFVTDEDDSAIRFGIEVDGTDLNIYAPGYDATLAGAISLGEWHLLDVSLDRDNGSGQADFIVLIDGTEVAVAAHSGLVADIPAGAAVTLFDDADHAGAATHTLIVFAALTVGRVLTLADNLLGSLALEVGS